MAAPDQSMEPVSSSDCGNFSNLDTGQAYVALSRCKTLDSLNLYRELKVRDALVDPDIQDFHAEHFG